MLLHTPSPEPAPANDQQTPEGTLDASNLGSPLVSIRAGGWASQPTLPPPTSEFDDTAWAVRDATDAFADVPTRTIPPGRPTAGQARWPNPDLESQMGRQSGRQKPFVWFRLHVKLAPNHGPLALLVELPVSQNTSMSFGSTGLGVDVFANGRPIQPEGPHGDAPQHYQQISRIYNLNVPPDETNLVLVRAPFMFRSATPLTPRSSPAAHCTLEIAKTWTIGWSYGIPTAFLRGCPG
jgi:hypothetical protein